MLDKLTNDLFFRMAALNVNRIDFALGKGPPKVHVGAIALNDFYSRIILNKQRQAESEGHHGEPAGSADLADPRDRSAGIEGRGSSGADLDPDAGGSADRGGGRSWSQSGGVGESGATVRRASR